MGLSYRGRDKLPLLPIWINRSWSERNGPSWSVTVKLGPWSWNSRTGVVTTDLPFGFRHRTRKGSR